MTTAHQGVGQSVGIGLDVRNLVVPAARARNGARDGAALLDLKDLRIDAGACVGVRGPSGAGKTTLLLALAGLAPGARGTVRWGGRDLLAMGPGMRAAFRRSHVAMVFQSFMLFDELDPLANAAVSALFAPRAERSAIRRGAREALARMQAPTAQRPAGGFSGGERQRMAVARALAGDPAVVLADEPTASLDRANADRLADDLVGAARAGGRTLVIVSHDAALLARMDRVIALAHGRLVSDG